MAYKAVMKKICVRLQEVYGEKQVYAAFLDVFGLDSYDSPELSAKVDLENLEAADYFILFYPIRVVTSALTELGVALGMNKKILIVVPDKQILPYMVQGLPSLESKTVKLLYRNIEEENIAEDVLRFLESN